MPVAEVLFHRLKLRIVKRTKTGPSTDIEVLEKLAAEHAVPRLILELAACGEVPIHFLQSDDVGLERLERLRNPSEVRSTVDTHAKVNGVRDDAHDRHAYGLSGALVRDV